MTDGYRDGYWVIPEDIKLSWGNLVHDLRDAAESQGGKEMTFTLIVDAGRVTHLVEPQFRSREPRGTAVAQKARPWWSVIRRLQSVAGYTHRQIEMRIDLDGNGNPVCWREPDVRAMEPKKKRSDWK